jgi:hypothetical protein
MTIYGLGYAAVFGVFALLHVNAGRKSDLLGLTPVERHDAADNVRECLLNVGIAILSIAIANVGGSRWAWVAGITYALLGPVLSIHGRWSARRRRRLFPEAIPPAHPTPPR